MPEALTFSDVRPHSQAEQDQDESFDAHESLGLPYTHCKPREAEVTVLGILRDLFERLERPATKTSKRRKPRKRQERPKQQHGIQIEWDAMPAGYRVTREAIEALFYRVRPSSPEYGKEERRLAISEAPLAERLGTQLREPWLLVAFSIRQPRKTKIIYPLSARYVNVSWLNNQPSAQLKRLPQLATNWEAKRFVDTANLLEYDLSGFRPTSSERMER